MEGWMQTDRCLFCSFPLGRSRVAAKDNSGFFCNEVCEAFKEVEQKIKSFEAPASTSPTL